MDKHFAELFNVNSFERRNMPKNNLMIEEIMIITKIPFHAPQALVYMLFYFNLLEQKMYIPFFFPIISLNKSIVICFSTGRHLFLILFCVLYMIASWIKNQCFSVNTYSREEMHIFCYSRFITKHLMNHK
jgi:hypothetical protein